MEDKVNIKELLKKMERFRMKLNPEKSKQFLQNSGIIDDEGNLTQQYKNLRI